MSDERATANAVHDGGARAPIVDFILRVGVVVLALTFAISWLVDTYIPGADKIKEITQKVISNREAKLRIDGLISNNPRVSYELSVIREQKNDFAGATDEMIVALGILERTGARAEVMEPYKRRLDAMRAALAAGQSPAK